MYTQRFDLDTLEMGPDDYDGTVAYARAKRAQLVLMHEWVRRTPGTGVGFHAMHPGWADTPGIRESLPGFARVMGPLLRQPGTGGRHGGVAGGGARRGGVHRWLLAGPPPPVGAQGAVDAPVRAGVRTMPAPSCGPGAPTARAGTGPTRRRVSPTGGPGAQPVKP